MTQARDLLLIMISEKQINSVTPILKSIKVVSDNSINDNMRSIVNMKKSFQEKQYEENGVCLKNRTRRNGIHNKDSRYRNKARHDHLIKSGIT